LIALLVMNFDRYLATSHPIFHRTSVTKRRLFYHFCSIIVHRGGPDINICQRLSHFIPSACFDFFCYCFSSNVISQL
jgi:hypothetical protein